MNILELDTYSLDDAIKFHNRLNPRLWGPDEQLKPEVASKLLAIAADFQEFLGVPELDVEDITVSGSNAAFSYTPHSDIDLHLVIKMPDENREIYQELFNAKKYQYNDEHNIKIKGADVELYAQPSDENPKSQGIYSLMHNKWIQVPKRRKAEIDDTCVKSKVEDLDARIHSAIKSEDTELMQSLWGKIKDMRKSGLERNGEFGCENLAFKILRTNGCLKELKLALNKARDQELSMTEQFTQPIIYGYGSYTNEDVTTTPDGVSASTTMFLSEMDDDEKLKIVNKFIKDTAEWLGIEKMPKINLFTDPSWSEQEHSFGRFIPDAWTLEVNLANRHIMDILRTVAHELAHCRQHEDSNPPDNAGDTGSPWENEAHAIAGIVMRHFADTNPGLFENASGYIPKNKKEAKDPRWEMALSVDIKPGQVGKEANKLGLQTDKQGKPALLMKTANTLAESLAQELELFEEDLMEIKMTSKNLSKLAKEIPGVTVGLEFEMIVPNVDADEEGDLEPDYDQDESVGDIEDACNFFYDGDYNSRREIESLRDSMQEDYGNWVSEKIDEAWWGGDGFEYFKEYLDREDPFDEDEAQEEATNQLQAEYGDDITPEDFQKMLDALVDEKRDAYVQEKWDEQGYEYDHAREEFDQEQYDNYDHSDWLDDIGIHSMSDVSSQYDITWPYYTTYSDESETDTKQVALNFMNAMGMDSVAVGSYHGYGGGYEKWDGDKWVKIGSDKPLDCFTIEPDGSLEGDSSRDTGLEFVSPPIPLEDIGTVMKKVQAWAADNGVYTGKKNATSMHTNISIPGYDLDKLDYLKAAILLGDEHVLRQFDRIGNTYAKPAINKVKDLVKAKPEKAKELLDKMKSHLDAAASKLIHSGATDKYTSINTKDNRIEYRSPGGDYLSTIADDPQKMIDTINRMVVNIDAAMDPNKYKEEYQKKLYKILTGQEGGRESKTGAKKDAPKDTNDLLNIFSRYAAGELPKAALKSFVRQAQLERKGKKAEAELASHNWAIRRRATGDIIRTFKADDYMAAHEVLKQYKRDHNITDDSLTYGPYDSSVDKPAQAGGRIYKILDTRGGLIAGDEYGSDQEALQRAAYWAQRRNLDVVVKNDQGQEIGRVSSSGEITPAGQQPGQQPTMGLWDYSQGGFINSRGGIGSDQGGRLIGGHDYDSALEAARRNGIASRVENGEVSIRGIPQEQQPVPGSTLDLQRQRAAAQQSQQGNWGIWIQNAARFANQPGEYPRGAEVPLYRFPSREAAEQWIEQQRAARPNMRTDIEVREIEPAAQQPAGEPSSYELYRISDGRAVTAPAGNPIQFLATSPEDAESKIARYAADFNLGAPELFAVRSVLQAPAQSSGEFTSTENVPREGQPRNLVPTGPGPWEIYRISNGESVRRLEHTNRAAAEEEARSALGLRGEAPELYGVRTQQSTLAATGSDAAQGGLVDVAGEQPATGSFTGEWKVVDPNGTEIYRFSGVGNSQSDANNVAIRWLQRNPQHMQGGVEVLPVMG